MSKKRIILFANVSWGIYNFRLPLAHHLKKLGHEVIMISKPDEFTELLLKEGFQFYPIGLSRHGTNLFQELKSLFLISLIFLKVRPDVVLTFTIKPNFYSSLLRYFFDFKLIINITGLGTLFENGNRLRRVLTPFLKLAYRKTDYTIFQNPDDFCELVERQKFPIERWDIVNGSGVDVEDIDYLPIKRKNSQIKFSMLCRLIYKKGIIEFCEASEIVKKNYPETLFELWGIIEKDNPDALSETRIKELEKKYPFEFKGPTRRPLEVIKRSEVIVLPSKYKEGLPKILLEASASGRASITTDVPGCRHVIKNGVNGFLCQPSNSADLANKMEKYINLSTSETEEMSKNARRLAVEEYDVKFISEKYSDVIEEITSNQN